LKGKNMIEVYTGRVGSGKSNKLAQTLLQIVYRNNRYYKKKKIIRPIYTNFHIKPELEELFGGALRHWTSLEELLEVRDADIFIDEIFNYFDAKHWQELSFGVRRWLSQHRKFGIEIYGNCQDFAQVDISFRRMTTDLFYIVKVISSRDPSATRPPVKYIWGMSLIYKMNPTDYKEEQKENKTRFSGIMFITRDSVELFNTREEIKAGKFPPLQHLERPCSKPDCTYKRIIHQ
jgi:hypothetical protein